MAQEKPSALENLSKVSCAGRERLVDISLRLYQLASSFQRTGNYAIGDELTGVATNLQDISDKFGNAVSETIFYVVNEGEKSSRNCFNSALAGIQLAQAHQNKT